MATEVQGNLTKQMAPVTRGGVPVSGVEVDIYRYNEDGERSRVAVGVTDIDGYIVRANGDDLYVEPGMYDLEFRGQGLTHRDFRLRVNIAGDNYVQAAELTEDCVHKEHLNPDCAGGGMTQAADGALQVDVDQYSLTLQGSGAEAQVAVKNDGVHKEHLNPDCAGGGLVQSGDGALQANPDDDSLELSGDVLQLKAAGVQYLHLRREETEGVNPVYVVAENIVFNGSCQQDPDFFWTSSGATVFSRGEDTT